MGIIEHTAHSLRQVLPSITFALTQLTFHFERISMVTGMSPRECFCMDLSK
jgi:hypothetical protein